MQIVYIKKNEKRECDVPLKLVDKEDCSTKGGTRKSDRKKLEAKRNEKSTEKEIVRTIRGQKYGYLIYWDKTQNVPRQKCLGKIDI